MHIQPAIQQCPSCSAVIPFKSSETNVLACACGSVLQRNETGTVDVKPYYIVPGPHDFIQPGTEGTWQGRKFTVLGRFRAWIEEFVFNYWTIHYEDGSVGYLGEGYGLFAIYAQTDAKIIVHSSELDKLKPGEMRKLDTKNVYYLERKYTCYKWELEGEARMPGFSSFRSFEFAGLTGEHLELMEFGKDVLVSFSVTYTMLEALNLSGLREVTPPVKTHTCSHCATVNEWNGYPYTQSLACVQCGTRYAMREGAAFKNANGRNATDPKPVFPLGSKGTLRGTDYELVGFAVKEENNQYHAKWREYTLFNRKAGFATLSEFDGHWTFLREQPDAPVLPRKDLKEFDYADEPFQLFNSYYYKTINAAGVFPYNTFNDGDKIVREFISPPEIWIEERCPREGIVWFNGEHISGKELKHVFGSNIELPPKSGVGAVDPMGFINFSKLFRVGFGALLLLLLAHLVTSFLKENRVIISQVTSFPDTAATVSFVSDKFTLEKWRSNLQFDIYAPVSNSWFECNATLVNTKDGTEYSIEKGVEYYSGYSEGEYWTEGDTHSQAFLSKIPAGEYQLQVLGAREYNQGDSFVKGTPEFSLTVTYDVTNHRNLLICGFLLLLWPFIRHLMIQNNEKKRWENSPYAP